MLTWAKSGIKYLRRHFPLNCMLAMQLYIFLFSSVNSRFHLRSHSVTVRAVQISYNHCDWEQDKLFLNLPQNYYIVLCNLFLLFFLPSSPFFLYHCFPILFPAFLSFFSSFPPPTSTFTPASPSFFPAFLSFFLFFLPCSFPFGSY